MQLGLDGQRRIEKKKSFQTHMNWRTATAPKAGNAMGKTILKNTGVSVPGTGMRNELRRPSSIALNAAPNFVKDGVKRSKFHQPPMISGSGRNAAIPKPTKGNSQPIASPQAKRWITIVRGRIL